MINYFDRKGKLSTCEDSLTSTVFDRLKYLPVELFWGILRKSLFHDKLPLTSGDIQAIEYWPHWDSEILDGIELTEIDFEPNTQFVEPDLFIRFSEFDIIIEAKRRDRNQEEKGQMQREVMAYYKEYKEYKQDNKKLYFIRLGGLLNIYEEEDYTIAGNKAIICKTDWSRILDEIVKLKAELSEISTSYNTAHVRLLDDLITGLEMHQFFKINWLSEFRIKSKLRQTSFKNLFVYEKPN